MKTPSQLVNDPSQLKYNRGWSYQDQLGKLDTYAPHVLPSKESLPKGVGEVWEQEITRAGFIPVADHRASYLYRAHSGPGWKKDGVSQVAKMEIAPDWVTGTVAQLSVDHGSMPRKYQPLATEEGHTLLSLKTLFYNRDISIGVSPGNQPMPFFFRNADGDDLYFVHRGTGFVETELGIIHYEQGHFVWLPKGILYRIVPTSKEHTLLHMENYGEKFQKPETGITGDAAVYYHRNIEVPQAHFVTEAGDYQVIIKLNGTFTSYMYPHHPMDVVGWDGDLFPFRLHIKDINPITSWRAHIPPSAYCTFFGGVFEYCAFVPRPVETGKNSLPVPFDHINIDRDEVIFYSEGTFFSKNESNEGSLTFHPRGFSHGPHPSAAKREMERRDKEGAFNFEGYFILIETQKPLIPAAFASTVEDSSYINSWQ